MPQANVVFGTYGFSNIVASISGPGGTFPIGSGAGAAEEGITIEPDGDKITKSVGADGAVMYALHSDMSGRVLVRLQKIAPTNALLSAMYNVQITDSSLVGQNTILITDIARGDNIFCRGCAFARPPTINYGTAPSTMEWSFFAAVIDRTLGVGVVNVTPP